MYFSDISKKSITIQIYVQISSLLPSILGWSTTSIRPIYRGIGVSLRRFKYPATQKTVI